MRSLARAACLALAALLFFFVPRGGTAVVRAAAPGTFGDFDGDGRADLAVFRQGSVGMWHIEGQEPLQWGMPGDIPVVGDYDGNGVADVAVYRAAGLAKWFIRGQATQTLGNTGAVPVPADYDGDGRTDIAVFEPDPYTNQGTWRWEIYGSPVLFGARGDKPTAADIDADGKADLIVYRPSAATWFTATAASNYATVTATPVGLPGDVPLAGDVEGDGRADLILFRPALGRWFVLGTAQGGFEVPLGALGDVPMLADVSGDGVLDFCVWTPSTGTWRILDRAGTGATTTAQLGAAGDVPALERPQRHLPRIADYDGDGLDELTVFRDVAGVGYWYQRFSATDPVFSANGLMQWGLGGDTTVPGDYDGDRRTDYAVFRSWNATWYLKLSSGSTREIQWGLPGDVPSPADFDGDGRTDPVVFRPSTTEWFALLSGSDFTTFTYRVFGFPEAQPISAQLDDDGRADLLMWRPSTARWYLYFTQWGYGERAWGLPDDIPLAFDADGDGMAELVPYQRDGYWYTCDTGLNRYWNGLYPLRQLGLASDTPVPHDYDGDGITDLAVWRPENGTWYVRYSSNDALMTYQWGLNGDQPVLRIDR